MSSPAPKSPNHNHSSEDEHDPEDELYQDAEPLTERKRLVTSQFQTIASWVEQSASNFPIKAVLALVDDMLGNGMSFDDNDQRQRFHMMLGLMCQMISAFRINPDKLATGWIAPKPDKSKDDSFIENRGKVKRFFESAQAGIGAFRQIYDQEEDAPASASPASSPKEIVYPQRIDTADAKRCPWTTKANKPCPFAGVYDGFCKHHYALAKNHFTGQ